jgi:hypothetical protein
VEVVVEVGAESGQLVSLNPVFLNLEEIVCGIANGLEWLVEFPLLGQLLVELVHLFLFVGRRVQKRAEERLVGFDVLEIRGL